LINAKPRVPALRGGQPDDFAANGIGYDRILVAALPDETENHPQQTGNPGNFGLNLWLSQ
jgi:hypothetical protein